MVVDFRGTPDGRRKPAREGAPGGPKRQAPAATARPYLGSPGVGAQCAICELPVQATEMEFEIEFARDGSNPGLDKFHVHLQCFAAWEFERGSA